jgi:hypothetical protein
METKSPTPSLNGKSFRSISNTSNGEVSSETIFLYKQEGKIISAEYHGGSIQKGHLIGTQSTNGQLTFVYHHINIEGNLKVGECISIPSITEEGKITFTEEWKWLTGDMSEGKSQIVEI